MTMKLISAAFFGACVGLVLGYAWGKHIMWGRIMGQRLNAKGWFKR